MALTTTLTYKISTVLTKALQQTTPTDTLAKDLSDTLASGINKDEADTVFHDIRTLAKNAAENIDLNGGFNDPLGDSATLTKLKGLVIHNRSTTVGDNLLIGGGATNFKLFKDLTGRYELGPDGIMSMWEPSLAGKTVTAATADLLRVENQGTGSISYDLIVIGIK